MKLHRDWVTWCVYVLGRRMLSVHLSIIQFTTDVSIADGCDKYLCMKTLLPYEVEILWQMGKLVVLSNFIICNIVFNCFQLSSAAKASESVCMWERVNAVIPWLCSSNGHFLRMLICVTLSSFSWSWLCLISFWSNIFQTSSAAQICELRLHLRTSEPFKIEQNT